MKTEPTPITSGCAGIPLSHQATESRRNATNQSSASRKTAGEAISDTLETGDREADGRQPLPDPPKSDHEHPDHGSILDVSG